MRDVQHGVHLDRHPDGLDIIDDALRDDTSAVGGVLAEECAALCYRPADVLEQANI